MVYRMRLPKTQVFAKIKLAELTECAPGAVTDAGGFDLWSASHAQRAGKHTNRNVSNALDAQDETKTILALRERPSPRDAEGAKITDQVIAERRAKDARTQRELDRMWGEFDQACHQARAKKTPKTYKTSPRFVLVAP